MTYAYVSDQIAFLCIHGDPNEYDNPLLCFIFHVFCFLTLSVCATAIKQQSHLIGSHHFSVTNSTTNMPNVAKVSKYIIFHIP